MIFGLASFGCTEVPPENPYDPETPASGQEGGGVQGRLRLPTQFGAHRFDDRTIELRSVREPTIASSAAALDTVSREDSGDGSGDDSDGEGIPTAKFTFFDVKAGTYSLFIEVRGFQRYEAIIEVAIADTVDVGLIELDVDESAAIEGRATLGGAPEGGHAGIFVEALGSPFNTFTGAEGDFRLAVAAGNYTLRVSHPGFETASLPEIDVAAREVLTIDKEVVLEGAPGRIRGTVALPAGFPDATLLTQVAVARFEAGRPDGEDAEPAEPVESVGVDPDGQFVLGDVSAGDWRVVVTLDSFFEEVRMVRVDVGDDVDLGVIRLTSEAVDAARPSGIEGRVLRQGAAADGHGGIRVEAVNTPFATQTTSEGRFQLALPPQTYTLRFSTPGYGTLPSEPVVVPEDEFVALREDVVLAARPGQVRGSVSVSPGIRLTGGLGSVDVRLVKDGADPETPAPEDVITQSSPGEDGLFLTDEIAAGTYRLDLIRDGLQRVRMPIVVEVGAITRVAHVVMRPVDQAAVITGVAQIFEAADDAHGGIAVELVGGTARTETTAAGSFELVVPARAEPYVLRFAREGYGTEQAEMVGLDPHAREALPEDVRLLGLPGAIRGAVALPALAHTPDNLQAVDVHLWRDGDEAAAQQVHPDADGAWIFERVPAGAWRVELSADGFDPETVEVVVGLGETVRIPRVALSVGDVAARVFGTARVRGAADGEHGGIRVEARHSAFWTETTADGDWALALAPRAGGYELVFSKDGYGSVVVPTGPVVDGDDRRLEAEISLDGEPARVSGRVAVPADYAQPGLLVGAELVIAPRGGGGEPVAQGPAAEDGSFVFGELAAGSYTLTGRLDGFASIEEDFALAVGQGLDLGRLAFAPLEPTAELFGTAEIAGAAVGAHGGILVELDGAPNSAVTSSAGRWSLPVAPRAAGYTVRFSRAGYETTTVDSGPVVDRARVEVELALLQGQPGSIRGVVGLPAGFDPVGRLERTDLALFADGDGEPVAQMRPDAQGWFVFEGVAAGAYRVTFVLDGFLADERFAVVEVGAVADIGHVVLRVADPTARLFGRAEIAGGGPNAHGGVLVEIVGEARSMQTTSAGEWSFDVAPRQGGYTLRFSRGGYAAATADTGAVAERAEIEIGTVILEGQPGTIRGSVGLPPEFDPTGRINSVDVTLIADGEELPRAQVRPDDRGRFLFEDVAAGLYRVAFAFDGFAPAERPVIVEVGAVSDVGHVVLVAPEPTARIFGRAQIAGGGPNAHGGILVEIVGEARSTVTTSIGDWSLDVAPRRAGYALRFSRAGYEAADEATGEVRDGQELEVRLVLLDGQPGRVRGSVGLPAGFDPTGRIDQVDIALFADGADGATAQIRADEQGRFLFADVAAGLYRVTFALDGFLPDERPVVVEVGAIADIGHVVLEAPEPTARLYGRAEIAGGGANAHGGILVELDGEATSAITTSVGDWSLDVAPRQAGYALRFGRAGYQTATAQTEAIGDGAEVELGLVILAGQPGSVRGSVALPAEHDPTGRLDQIDVALYADGEAEPAAQARPDGRGRYVFDAVPAGVYRIAFVLDGFLSAERDVVVAVGAAVEVAHVILEAPERAARLFGRAQIRGGAANAHGGILVEIVDEARSTLTNSAGDWSFDVGPRAGGYTLRFSRPGYEAASVDSGAVVDRAEVEVGPVLLDGQPGSIRGSISLPAGFDPAGRLSTVDVALFEDGGEAPVAQGRPNALGQYVFDDVAAGLYRLTFALDGFAGTEALVLVEVGAVAVVGHVVLGALEPTARLFGRAEIAGGGVNAHGNILVELVGEPRSTVTTSTGDWSLDVSPRQAGYRLRFSRAGHAAAIVDTGEVADGDDLEVGPTILAGQPGAIRGSVGLPPEVDPVGRIDRVDVSLFADGDDVPAAQRRPDASGRYGFEGIAAGLYRLTFALDGFEIAARPVVVEIGATADAGHVVLTSLDATARVFGRAELAGGAAETHGGILVEVVGESRSAVTTSVGEWSFDLAPRLGGYTIRFSRAGYSAQTVVTGEVGDGAQLELGPVILPGQPGSVRGSVDLPPEFDSARRDEIDVALFADGAAIPNSSRRPDARGRFVFDAVPAGDYTVTYVLDGFEPASRPVVVEVGAATEIGHVILVALAPTAEVHGTAELVGGGPNAHGGILVEVSGTSISTVTTSAGAWSLSVAPSEEGYALRFSRAGFQAAIEPTGRIADGASLEIRTVILLGQPGSVRGSVALPTGFAGAGVDAIDVSLIADGQIDARAQTRPDGAGRYVFENVPAGRYTVHFTFDGFEPADRPVIVEVGAAADAGHVGLEPEDETVVLDGAARIQGGADGAHGGIRVEAIGTPFWTETTAAGDWQFALPRAAGGYSLRFSRDGFGEQIRDTGPLAGPGFTLPAAVFLIGEPSRIIGSVALAQGFGDVETMRRVSVALRPNAAGSEVPPTRQVGPEDDGSFVLDGIAPGTWRLDVTAPGFELARVVVEVPVGSLVAVGRVLLLPVQQTGAVYGVARIEGGGPEVHGGIRVEARGTNATTVTTSTGTWQLDLPANPLGYTLRFSRERYNAVDVPVAALGAAAVAEVDDVTLVGQPSTIRGTVALPPGFDAPGAVDAVRAELRGADGQEAAVAQNTLGGRYRFDGLAAGDYAVTLRLDGFRIEAIPVVIDVGETSVADHVVLLPLAQEGTIVGTATRQGAGAGTHGGIRVEVVGTPSSTLTNSDGQFAIVLPARDAGYTLRFLDSGSTPVDVADLVVRIDDVTVAPPVVLVSQPGAVVGRVVLAEGFGPGLVTDVIISVFQLAAGEGGDAFRTGAPLNNGFFEFRNLPPGFYTVRFELPGFRLRTRTVSIEPGETLNAGDISMLPSDEAEALTLIEGTALRAGSDDHSGVLVEAVGTPFTGLTSSIGGFQLLVNPDTHVLRFTTPGYGVETVDGVEAVLGERVTLAEPVVLQALPATLRGVVSLEIPNGDDAVGAGVTVELLAGNVVVEQTGTGALGAFVIDTTAGTFIARISAPRYAHQMRPVRLVAGDAFDLGAVRLTLARADLAGAVTFADTPQAGGAQVIVTGNAADPNVAGFRRTAEARPPAGAFEVDGLPLGLYDVVAVADGYVTSAPEAIRLDVADATGAFAAELESRLAFPVASAAGPSPRPLHFERDDDLLFAQVWLGNGPPPADVGFEPLGGAAQDEALVALPVDGHYEVRARLANGAYLDAEPGNDLFASVTPVLVATLVRDTDPPAFRDLEVGDGRGYTRARLLDLRSTCRDALTDDDELRLRVEVDDGTRYDGPWFPALTILLADVEGPKVVSARCVDGAGLESEVLVANVLFDGTPPVIDAFALNEGRADEPTPDRTVTVHLAIGDNLSGPAATAVAETDVDCADADFLHPTQGTFAFPLTGGEGVHSLFVCARDRAGNVTPAAIESGNAVRLDTQAPAAPTVELGNGSGWSSLALVGLDVATTDDDTDTLRVELSGDLADGPRTFAWAALPRQIALTAGDGPRRVTAVMRDAAENPSAPTTATITVDSVAPEVVAASVGDGSGYVTAPSGRTTIAVSCRDAQAAPERLALVVTVDGAIAYEGPYRDVVGIDLGAEDGARSVVPTCADPAGGRTAGEAIDVVHDATPPSVNRFALETGADDLPVHDRTVAVDLDVVDALTGVAGVALAEQDFDCVTAQYTFPAQGTVQFTLSTANGPRRLFLCAADGAGNVTPAAIASDNAVLLDTVRPARPGLTLGDGSGWSTVEAIDFRLTTIEADPTILRVTVEGDVVDAPIEFAWGDSPATLPLSPGAGARTVSVYLTDPAGLDSRVVDATIRVDLDPPVLAEAIVGAGTGYVTDAQGATFADVICVDESSTAAEMTLVITEGADVRYDDAYQPIVGLDLGPAEGPRALSFVCRDASGRIARLDDVEVIVDHTAPTVSQFALNAGRVDEPTRDRVVTVHLDVRDATSGVEGVALAEAAPDCATASYIYPAAGDVAFVLSGGDGPHGLSLCARDIAGNITAAAIDSANRVALDTRAPAAPTVALGDGSRWSDDETVGLALGTTDDDTAGHRVVVTGDVVDAPVEFTWDTPPATLELAAGSGRRKLVFTVLDAADNVSAAVEAEIYVDLSAPALVTFDLGAFVTDPLGQAVAEVVCTDAEASAAELSLVITSGADVVYDGVYRSAVALDLGADEGPRTLTAVCADRAGHSDTVAGVAVVVDHTPPVISGLSVNGGAADISTPDRTFAVTLDVADATSGVTGIAIAESAFDCATAEYAAPPAGDLLYEVVGPDGPVRIFACARDAAGNATEAATPAGNLVVLDTRAPASPTGWLGDGSGWSQGFDVDVALATTDDDTTGYDVTLDGDFVGAPRTLAWGALPASITLTAGAGAKRVTARVTDEADNTSGPVELAIRVDRAAPEIVGAVIGDGSGFVTDAAGSTFLDVTCVDAEAATDELRLVVTEGADTRYDGTYQPLVGLDLGAVESTRTLRVVCRDPSGREDFVDPLTVTVDATAPVVELFTLNTAVDGARTADRNITAHVRVTDGGSGVAGVAIASADFDCATAQLVYPADGDFSFTLPAVDGAHTLYLCARDVAGNRLDAAVESTNGVVLDTDPPGTPRLTLGDGDGWTQGVAVGLRATTTDDDTSGYTLHLEGDIEGETLTAAWDALPGEITVTATAGAKSVTAWIEDGAGNLSAPATRVISLDLTLPQLAALQIADGGDFTHRADVGVSAVCADAEVGQNQLTLIVREGLAVRYDGPWLPLVGVDLAGDDGLRTLTARCVDPSQRVSAERLAAITLDREPPAVEVFTLNGGGAPLPTAERIVTVDVRVTDALSGVVGTAVSQNALDCATANYSDAAVGQFEFTLSAINGARSLYLCAKDGAGNRTTAAIASQNQVIVDTVAPARPTLVVQDGAAWTQGVDVTAALSTTDDDTTGYEVTVAGDVSQDGQTYAWNDWPGALTLTPGAGEKTISVHVTDRADNVSPTQTVTVSLDDAAPTLIDVVIGDGTGFVTHAQGSTIVAATCVDAEATANALRLRVTEGAVVRYDGVYQEIVGIDLGAEQGARTLSVRCTDGAGRFDEDNAIAVTVDSVPPSVTTFRLNRGGVNEPTRKLNITVTVAVDDVTSGAVAVAVTELPTDCANAQYSYPPNGAFGYVLSDTEGVRNLFLCARDAAGNHTGAEASGNALLVDTLAPGALDVTLGNGSGWSQDRLVGLALATGDDAPDDYEVTVRGDVVGAPRSFVWSDPPPQIPLTLGAGEKFITFEAEDAAGNRSPVTERIVHLDTEVPTLLGAGTANGTGFVRNPAGVTLLDISCFDPEAPPELLTVVVTEGADVRYDGPLVDLVPVTLGGVEGLRTLRVVCRDAAERGAVLDGVELTVDYTPPTITTFALNEGGAAEPTNDRNLSVELAVTDATTGVIGTALSPTSFDCTTAQYGYPASGTVGFRLTGADGVRALFLCAKDGAGNVTASAAPSGNTVRLDTVTPAAPTFALGDGSGFTDDVDVDLVLSTTDDDTSDLRVVLAGDVVGGIRTFAWADKPAQITLRGGAGLRQVYAAVVDGAGNRSEIVEVPIVVDLSAPEMAVAVVGDGSGYVTDADGSSFIQVICFDYETDDNDLRLRLAVDGVVVYDNVYRTILGLTVGGAEVTRTVTATCTDGAGHTDVRQTSVLVDYTPPTITRFVLNGGGVDEPTNERDISVDLGVDDAVSGVGGAAVDDVPFDCGHTEFPIPGSGHGTFTVGGVDGVYSLFVCARDKAGNFTAASVASDNRVLLDTLPPANPRLVIANGDSWVDDPTGVAIALTTTDLDTTGYRIRLGGDIAAGIISTVWADRPGTIDLIAAQGTHQVEARMRDAAGNVSEVVSVPVIVDATDPVLGALRIGNNSGYSTERTPTLAVDCSDDLAPSGQLRLRVGVDAGIAYDGDWVPEIAIDLGDTDGDHTVNVACFNPADRRATALPRVITLDRLPPVIQSFDLLGGQPIEPTNRRQISGTLTITDATSGPDVAAVGDSAFDCTTGRYNHEANGLVRFTLVGGDGRQSLFVCARDQAGNTTAAAVESDNEVQLDTVAPEPGDLILAGGNRYTNELAVSVDVATSEAGLTAVLTGGLFAEPQQVDVSALPIGVLVARDGTYDASAVLVDAAGNISVPFSATVTRDTQPPAAGFVTFADGGDTVNSRLVPVTIANTNPSTMAIWESAGACGQPACDDPRFDPFSPQTAVTLSANRGPKTLCWRFCDLAGNATPVGTLDPPLVLGTYIERPRPILVSTFGQSREAFAADRSLRVNGRGIAHDTQVQIGDFLVECGSTAEDCGPDPDGGCAPLEACDDSCDNQCIIDMPEAVIQNAGTYPVRLVTPPPVVDNISTSVDVVYFSIVAPLPVITSIEPRGGSPVRSDGLPMWNFDVRVQGYDILDNTQFRIGPIFASVLNPSEITIPYAPADRPQRQVTLRIDAEDLEGLVPLDLEDYEVVAINPGPGGGEGSRPFGWNPELVPCRIENGCRSNLRWTREPLLSGRGLFQDFDLEGPISGGFRWRGGQALTLFDADGETIGRFPRSGTHDGVPVLPFHDVDHFRLEDASGTHPQVVMTQGGRRGAGYFDNRREYVTGTAPESLAIGDIDGDGQLDAAVANRLSHDVMIFFGLGDGTFEEGYGVTVGRTPFEVRLADLDADGDLDLITADRDDQVVSYRLNRGDRNFDLRRTIEIGSSLNSVEVGDLNHDGTPDILAVHDGTSAATIAHNRGDGTFRAPYQVPLDSPGRAAVIADLDADGDNDFATINWNETAEVFLWTADDEFVAQADITFGQDNPEDIEAADLDGDGVLDLFTGDGNGRIFVARGTGNGTYAAQVDWDMRVAGQADGRIENITAADINGDGFIDLIAAVNLDGHVVWRMGTGGGDFSAAQQLNVKAGPGTGPGAFDIALADFDGDGALDLATLNSNFSDFVTFDGVPGASLGGRQRIEVAETSRQIAAGDFNGDGRTDLVMVSPAAVHVLHRLANGTYHERIYEAAGSTLVDVKVHDQDGDGVLDILALRMSADVEIYWGGAIGAAGRRQFQDPPQTVDGGNTAAGLEVEQVDGALDTDLLISDQTGDEVRYLTGNGRSFAAAIIVTRLGAAPANVRAIDIDGDGDADLMGMNGDSLNTLSISRWAIPPRQRFGSFQPRTTYAFNGQTGDWRTGDFDGDGNLDVFVANMSTENASLRFGNGDGTFGNLVTVDMIERQSAIDVADIDGDGYDDLIGGTLSGLVVVRRSLGAGRTFAEPIARPLTTKLNQVLATDLDDDTVPDLIVAQSDAPSLFVDFLPSATGWNLEVPIIDAPVGRIRPGTTTFPISLPAMYVDRLGLHIRMKLIGTEDTTANLTLYSPGGPSATYGPIDVTRVVGGTEWGFHIDAAAMRGWQPAGEWTLQIDIPEARGSIAATLTVADLRFHSWYHRAPCGKVRRFESYAAPHTDGISTVVTGNTTRSSSEVQQTCRNLSRLAPEDIWAFTVPADGNYQISTAGKTFDTVLSVRNTCAAGNAGTLACNDDFDGQTDSQVTVNGLTAGQVIYLNVDGTTNGQSGAYTLTVTPL